MGVGFIGPEFDDIISEINGPRRRVYHAVMQRARVRLEGRPARRLRCVRLGSDASDDQGELRIRASDVLVGTGDPVGRRPSRCDFIRIKPLIQVGS